MAEVKVDISFHTTFTQKEFSVLTRSLAGHELTTDDIKLALELNRKLCHLRAAQVRQYSEQATHAFKYATEELKQFD